MLLLKLFQPIVKLQGQAYYCTQFANRGQWNIFIFAQQCCCFLLFGLSFDAMISHQNVSKKVLSQLALAKVSLKKLLNLGSILLQDLIMTFARILAHLRVLQDCSNCGFNSRAWLISLSNFCVQTACSERKGATSGTNLNRIRIEQRSSQDCLVCRVASGRGSSTQNPSE